MTEEYEKEKKKEEKDYIVLSYNLPYMRKDDYEKYDEKKTKLPEYQQDNAKKELEDKYKEKIAERKLQETPEAYERIRVFYLWYSVRTRKVVQ